MQLFHLKGSGLTRSVKRERLMQLLPIRLGGMDNIKCTNSVTGHNWFGCRDWMQPQTERKHGSSQNKGIQNIGNECWVVAIESDFQGWLVFSREEWLGKKNLCWHDSVREASYIEETKRQGNTKWLKMKLHTVISSEPSQVTILWWTRLFSVFT